MLALQVSRQAVDAASLATGEWCQQMSCRGHGSWAWVVARDAWSVVCSVVWGSVVCLRRIAELEDSLVHEAL